MIDLHHHLLHGVDDGPCSLEQSLALARRAMESGLTHVVCTPHLHGSRYAISRREIQERFAQLQRALASAGIPLRLALSAEVHCDSDVTGHVSADRIAYLGHWQGKRILLLELPPATVPLGLVQLVGWLREREIVPMLAHPERNKSLQREPQQLHALLNAGCLAQITAGSLTGRFGPRCQAFARDMVCAEKVTVVASDAHDIRHRPPDTAEAVRIVNRLLGRRDCARLFLEAPQSIAATLFP